MNSKAEAVLTILMQHGVLISGDIVTDGDAENRFFVRVPVKRGADNRQIPSRVRLSEAKRALEESGFSVNFLLIDELKNDIEAGLRATLLHQDGELIRNVFMSSSARAPHVWIETKRELSEDVFELIKTKVSRYLCVFDVEPKSITTTSGYRFPSVLACMRCVRNYAPVDVAGINEILSRNGFTVPSEDWLKRRLDLMRKDGAIVWVAGNKYCLSMTSILKLGTSRSRMSPDVSRLLALARGMR